MPVTGATDGLSLAASPEAALRAAFDAAESSGLAVEAITRASATGDGAAAAGYRMLVSQPQADGGGPLLAVVQVEGVEGRASVRIVQCGFGDERQWAELLAGWAAAPRQAQRRGMDVSRDALTNRRSDPLPTRWGGAWDQREPAGAPCLPGLGPLPGMARPPRLPGRADPDLVARLVREFAAALERFARGGAPSPPSLPSAPEQPR